MASPAPIAFEDGHAILIGLMKIGLAGHGFRHLKALTFGRSERGVLETINFGATRGRGKEFCTTFGVGVHFETIERLLHPDRVEELLSTVGMPLSALKDWKQFPQWCFDGHSDPESIAAEILVDIQSYALPFLYRFGTLSAVRESLLKPDPREWFVLDPQQRIAVLVAIDHLEGRPAEAIHRLDEALQLLQDQPPKKRWELDQLRARLLENR